MKHFFTIIPLLVCISVVAKCQIKTSTATTYQIQPYNEDALLLKSDIVRILKFPKDSKWNNSNPIMQVDILFTNDSKIESIIAKSNTGHGTEDNLIKTLTDYNRKRSGMNREKLLKGDTASNYLFQLPLFLFTEDFRAISPKGLYGASTAGVMNAERKLFVDLTYIGIQTNFSNMLPAGGFQNFANEICGLFAKNLSLDFSGGSLFKLGDAMVKFKVSNEGQLTDIKAFGYRNSLNKNFIKILNEYATAFKWKAPPEIDMNGYEFVLFISLI
ncbi:MULTISPECIES: hypothetical protein [Sphingobacterium]|uniref:hypothetical protein n=1 Tax=Sphingobacterium TaxID=28453 RepID=UPI0013DD36F9|nr:MULTISPECIES: hypothetical protein [unclassified Sphingobacterium]